MAAVLVSPPYAAHATGTPAAPGASNAFASAVMLRLLVQGMQSLGLQTHAASPSQAQQGPHVQLATKRALLQRQGLQGLRASVAGHAVWPDASEPDLRALATAGRTGVWHLEWDAQTADAADAADAALAQVPASIQGGATSGPADICAGLPWPDEALRCAAWVQQDPLHRPDLAAAAHALDLAPRSLQRALARAGLHFSGVVAEVRVRSAAWWLLHSALPIAEVGFVCGYADQAHFSRCFKQRTGWSPGAYRNGFGR